MNKSKVVPSIQTGKPERGAGRKREEMKFTVRHCKLRCQYDEGVEMYPECKSPELIVGEPVKIGKADLGAVLKIYQKPKDEWNSQWGEYLREKRVEKDCKMLTSRGMQEEEKPERRQK